MLSVFTGISCITNAVCMPYFLNYIMLGPQPICHEYQRCFFINFIKYIGRHFVAVTGPGEIYGYIDGRCTRIDPY